MGSVLAWEALSTKGLNQCGRDARQRQKACPDLAELLEKDVVVCEHKDFDVDHRVRTFAAA